MACEVEKKTKCFTFIWKVENADHWWKRTSIASPAFTVEEIEETKWKLLLNCPFYDRYCGTNLCLRRQTDDKGAKNVEINCELAFLSSDGTVLHSFDKRNAAIQKDGNIGSNEFPSRYEMFFARRSAFLSQDTLTVRCRIWKSVGKISTKVQLLARTRIAVEKRLFLWNIEDFSALNSNDKKTYKIKSFGSGEQLMTLELFSSGGVIYEETIRLKIIPICRNIKLSILQLSIVDASKNTVNCLLCELFPPDSKEFTLYYTKRELMEKKSAYLPNDVLTLSCECSFSFGNLAEEIEGSSSNCPVIKHPELDQANELPAPKCILINDLKSMLNNSSLSDVKLKTKSKTYPAHKFILGVRSPVFKAMFSSDMREKMNDCVDIDDLSDETVLQMLRYLYCADVEELEWGRATELYEAADKYQILHLKDICSSFLKTNLHPEKACEALVLADMHQDEAMKRFVQDFVLSHGKDIINSEEWKQLMETNVKLATETMCLKYKE